MTRLPESAPQYARDLELRALKAEALYDGLQEGVNWLMQYVTSSKFKPLAGGGNPYVNVDDVVARLRDAESLAMEYEAAVQA